jgi:hypothetical protein
MESKRKTDAQEWSAARATGRRGEKRCQVIALQRWMDADNTLLNNKVTK